jgi:hypothetical protein
MAAVSSPDALRLWLVLVVTLGWAIVVGACGGKRLSGEELVQERCTKCHTLAPIEVARKTRPEWQRTVYRMIEKGARLNDREAQEVIDYVSSVYGAKSP